MTRKALILVDVQNDFVPGGALPVPEGHRVVPVLNELMPHFDLVVATKDWHPADHGSFAATHGRKIGEVITLGGVAQFLWPTHCVQNTPGADFVPGLETGRIRRAFLKGTERDIDNYSGFFESDARAAGLGDYLKEQGVTDVYIGGLATDYCVKATAMDARELGFETRLIEDACRGVDVKPGDSARAVEEMRQAGVTVTNSREILGQAK